MKRVLDFSAEALLDSLRSRYAPPVWTFFSEVFASVGGGTTRADGIAVAMWRSRGLEIHGFEVKVSRSDWLRELKQPNKAEELFSYCDRWFLVTPDDSIIKDGELPPNWGWLVLRGGSLSVKAKAAKLDSIDLTKSFLCSVIRMAHAAIERARNEDPEGKINAAYHNGLKVGQDQGKYQHECDNRMIEAQKKMIADFQEASGVTISGYDRGKIGEAVRFVSNGGLESRIQELQSLKRQAERIATEVGAAISDMGARGENHN